MKTLITIAAATALISTAFAELNRFCGTVRG